MKGWKILALAAFIVAAQAAQAQDNATSTTTEDEAATTTDDMGMDDAALSTEADRGLAGSATMSVAAPEATSITSINEQAKAVKPRKIKGEIYSLNSVKMKQANEGHSAPESDTYFGLKYIINDKQSVSLRQPVSFVFPGAGKDDDEKMRVATSDLYINYSNAELAKFLGDGTFGMLGRIYFPTGEISQKYTKTDGSLSAWLYVNKPVAKRVALEYYLIPRWYNQTQNSYINSDGELKANRDYALTQVGSVIVNISSIWSFNQTVGTENFWYRASGGERTREHNAILDSAFIYSGIKDVSIIMGLNQGADLYEPSGNFHVYDQDDTSYYLLLTASL